LYFGADRFSNSGSANIAFWFFQKKVAQKGTETDGTCNDSSGCGFVGQDGTTAVTHKVGNVSLGGTLGTGCGPNHDPANTCTPGDILVISAFGPKAQIFVFEWVGAGNATRDYLESHGCFTAACSLQPLFIGSATSDCPEVTGDNACALANDTSSDSPWVLSQKNHTANNFDVTNLFEGGLNLTQLGLGGSCFPSYLINTRASAAGDAELHDKIVGQLSRCAPHLTTQQSVAANTDGSLGSVTPGTPVTDLATVQVTGATSPDDPLGTVQFYLCSKGTTGCASTTNPIGSAVTLSNAACNPASTSETDGKRCAVSLSVNDSGQTGARGPLAPGDYCFRAKATLTNYNNPDEFTNTTTECFNVTKNPSSLDTAPWIYPNDKATVSTTFATNITGSVTFRLFGLTGGTTGHDASYNCLHDDGTTSAVGLLYRETVSLPGTTATSKVVNTSNPGTTGTPNSVKVESTAIVYWRVSYGGDSLHFGRLSTCIENINTTLTPDTGGTAP